VTATATATPTIDDNSMQIGNDWGVKANSPPGRQGARMDLVDWQTGGAPWSKSEFVGVDTDLFVKAEGCSCSCRADPCLCVCILSEFVFAPVDPSTQFGLQQTQETK
jgi:hypothetical protein